MRRHITSTVSKPWQGWHPGEYQVHFIHTGVAESIFHIFPDGTTMLLDCGDHPALTRLEYAVPVMPNPGRLAGDWVARYIKRVLPQNCFTKGDYQVVDYMMLSHFHDDHSGSSSWVSADRERRDRRLPNCHRSGFVMAAEQLAFGKAIDRGWPDYDDPRPGYIESNSGQHMLRLYKALQERDGLQVEKFRLGAKDQIVPVHDAASVKGFEVTNITANGKILCKDGSIKDLYADYLKGNPPINENGMSLGIIVRYGDFSIYMAGDFSDLINDEHGRRTVQTEDLLAPELPRVNIAKINHHGHESMPAKIVRALAPEAWVACVWDQLHTLDHVMQRLSDRSLYPGDRIHFPTVFPRERYAAAAEKGYFTDIAPETLGLGAHVIVTVPPGGKSYRISCLSAADETMTILGEYEFA